MAVFIFFLLTLCFSMFSMTTNTTLGKKTPQFRNLQFDIVEFCWKKFQFDYRIVSIHDFNLTFALCSSSKNKSECEMGKSFMMPSLHQAYDATEIKFLPEYVLKVSDVKEWKNVRPTIEHIPFDFGRTHLKISFSGEMISYSDGVIKPFFGERLEYEIDAINHTYDIYALPIDFTKKDAFVYLALLVTLQCPENWYGCDCERFCKANSSHGKCDPRSGLKICEPDLYPKYKEDLLHCGMKDTCIKYCISDGHKNACDECGYKHCNDGYYDEDIDNNNCQKITCDYPSYPPGYGPCQNGGICINEQDYSTDTGGFLSCDCKPISTSTRYYNGSVCEHRYILTTTSTTTTTTTTTTITTKSTTMTTTTIMTTPASTFGTTTTAKKDKSKDSGTKTKRGGASAAVIVIILIVSLVFLAFITFVAFKLYKARQTMGPGSGPGLTPVVSMSGTEANQNQIDQPESQAFHNPHYE